MGTHQAQQVLTFMDGADAAGEAAQQYGGAAPPLQIGQTQIGRFGMAPSLGLSQGFIINRHASASRPDMLFRVVCRDDPLETQPG